MSIPGQLYSLDIKRKRGDTYAEQFTLKSSGVAVDITGFSFLLTVDTAPCPPDAANNLFQLTGTIVDGPGGIVEFPMTPVQADQTIGKYYYDVQQTDTGGLIKTVSDGVWEFVQDITK